jgi:hypothetical protein
VAGPNEVAFPKGPFYGSDHAGLDLRLCVGYAKATLIAARDRGTLKLVICEGFVEVLWRELWSSLSQALPGQPPLVAIFACWDTVVAKHEHSPLGLQIGVKPFLGILW